MAKRYKSKYYSDLNQFLSYGWTKDEINTYFPILESLSPDELLKLHQQCGIQMFALNEAIDQEQAIHVLVNSRDTPKELLFKNIQKLLHEGD